MKRVFEKVSVRDGAVMLFQIWSIGAEVCYLECQWTGDKGPAELLINQNGLVTNYADSNLLTFLSGCVTKAVRADREHFKEVFDRYGRGLSKLQPIWSKNTPLNREDLLAFYHTLLEAWEGLEWTYFLPLIGTIPNETKQTALDLRRRGEQYFDRSDAVIRKSLASCYPGLPFSHLLTFEEVRTDHIPDQNVLRAREKRYVIAQGKLYDAEPESVLERLSIAIEEEQALKERILKGTTACMGSARGVVRVILKKEDIGSMRLGEILVTSMSTPAFLPAMKLAAAIVTDEGGITCHAAIVAREIKKPTIIGTKIATKILKDGDEVEVDAKKGIIRVL